MNGMVNIGKNVDGVYGRRTSAREYMTFGKKHGHMGLMTHKGRHCMCE